MLLFNRYEYDTKTDLIGKGGFSRVYKAYDKKLNRWLALKIYKISQLSERYSAFAEIQRVINLDHPNICRYIDIDEVEKEDSLGDKEMIQVCVMELLDAGDFSSYYHSHGKDNEILRKLLQDIVKGLSYLHKNGVIHRDIKPANILIKETVEGPIAKITDFGISKRSDAVEDNTASALIVSVPYMAPEQFNVKKYGIEEKISYNIDFWSLGVAVYETITGDVLFKRNESDSREQVMNNIMAPELPEKIKNLPQPFRAFVSSCVIKDAKQRVQNAEDLLNILQTHATDYASPQVTQGPADEDISLTSTLVLKKPDATDETQLLTKPNREPKEIREVPKTNPVKIEPMSLFKRYEYNPLTALIGKGGFSRVYKAYDNKLNRWVALKIYKPGDFTEMYSPIAEIRRVVNLDHSNICRYLDIEEIEKENSFGEMEKTQVCVMELLDAGNFAEYYKANPSKDNLKKLVSDVLNGLAYLHKNGIIHRDIKPANILIKETIDGPVAKITDFGISKRSDAASVNTSSALIVSIPYMAPEQLNTKKYGIDEKISFNLDLWSLGVTIYEVVTGKILFKNSDQDTPEQIMANIMAPDLPEKIKDLPEPFRAIVAHCLVKDAKDRAQKAEELIILLHSNFNVEPILPKPIESSPVLPAAEAIETKIQTVPPEKQAKSFFFIESPKEEQKVATPSIAGVRKKIKSEKQLLYLRIAVVIAAILTSLILFMYLNQNKNQIVQASPAKLIDTAKTVPAQSSLSNESRPTEKAIPSDTQVLVQGKTALASPAPPIATPHLDSVDKQARKTNDLTKNRKAPEQATKATKNQKYVLELSTTETCTVKVNGDDYGELAVGRPMKLYLLPGKYIIEATSTQNGAKSYKGSLEVTQENLSQVGQFKIPL